MRQRAFGPTGKEVAVVGQGTWNLERDDRRAAIAALRRPRAILISARTSEWEKWEGFRFIFLRYFNPEDVAALSPSPLTESP